MLTREEVQKGFPEELTRFSDLVRSLSDDDWKRPSRCEGWTVADVAAHVIGGMADVVSFNLDGAGSPEWTQRQVDERKGRSPAELADELDQVSKVGNDLLGSFDDEAWNGPAPANLPGTLGQGVEALWYDAYVHADDIRAATGRPTEQTPGLRAAVSHAADLLDQKGWGPATLALDGMDEFKVGDGGRKITGDPHQFVLVATGRADPQSMGLDPAVNVYG